MGLNWMACFLAVTAVCVCMLLQGASADSYERVVRNARDIHRERLLARTYKEGGVCFLDVCIEWGAYGACVKYEVIYSCCKGYTGGCGPGGCKCRPSYYKPNPYPDYGSGGGKSWWKWY